MTKDLQEKKKRKQLLHSSRLHVHCACQTKLCKNTKTSKRKLAFVYHNGTCLENIGTFRIFFKLSTCNSLVISILTVSSCSDKLFTQFYSVAIFTELATGYFQPKLIHQLQGILFLQTIHLILCKYLKQV